MNALNNYFENLQANEKAMLLSIALEHDAIVSHQNDLRYEYGMQDRQERAEAEKEYNDNFNY